MEESLNGPVDENQDTGKKNLKSSSYPAKTLKEIIAFGNNIYKELGNHAFHDKDAIARANGLSYFTIKQTLSTAQQYGILINKYGGGYKLTDQFISIVHPKDNREYVQSIIISFNTSDIFKRLNDAFNNKRLPSIQGITSTLIRDGGLKEDVASKVAITYLENLKDFNFIDNNGFVCLASTTASVTPNVEPEMPTPPLGVAPPAFTPTVETPNTIDILIPLKDKRQAHLFIPEEYKDEDLVRIIKFVDALKNE